MTDEERIDLLDNNRLLTEENARLRKRLDELSLAFEATVGAFRELARDLGANCGGDSSRSGNVDPGMDGQSDEMRRKIAVGRLSEQILQEICEESMAHRSELDKALGGERIHGWSLKSIRRAMERRGMAHLLPSSETTSDDERTR